MTDLSVDSVAEKIVELFRLRGCSGRAFRFDERLTNLVQTAIYLRCLEMVLDDPNFDFVRFRSEYPALIEEAKHQLSQQ